MHRQIHRQFQRQCRLQINYRMCQHFLPPILRLSHRRTYQWLCLRINREKRRRSSHETSDECVHESADNNSHEGSYESADESSTRMFSAPKN
jgi:hypothetical protein